MKYFNDKEHLRRYEETLSRMKKNDCCHRSLAYLLTANDDTYRHINALFDFDEDGIITSGVSVQIVKLHTKQHTPVTGQI